MTVLKKSSLSSVVELGSYRDETDSTFYDLAESKKKVQLTINNYKRQFGNKM